MKGNFMKLLKPSYFSVSSDFARVCKCILTAGKWFVMNSISHIMLSHAGLLNHFHHLNFLAYFRNVHATFNLKTVRKTYLSHKVISSKVLQAIKMSASFFPHQSLSLVVTLAKDDNPINWRCKDLSQHVSPRILASVHPAFKLRKKQL